MGATQSKPTSAPAVQPMQAFLGMLMLMLLLGAAFYFLLYSPKDDEIKKLNQNLASTNSEIAKLEDKRRNLLAAQEEADKIQARLKLLQARLPSSQEQLDEFLSDVNQRQQNARVHQWMRYEPLEPVPDGEVDNIPIQMEFLASFDAASAFFWELSEMGSDDKGGTKEQIVNVRDVSIVRDDSTESGLVRVSGIIETYLYTGRQEQQQEDGERRRRRRK